MRQNGALKQEYIGDFYKVDFEIGFPFDKSCKFA